MAFRFWLFAFRFSLLAFAFGSSSLARWLGSAPPLLARWLAGLCVFVLLPVLLRFWLVGLVARWLVGSVARWIVGSLGRCPVGSLPDGSLARLIVGYVNLLINLLLNLGSIFSEIFS